MARIVIDAYKNTPYFKTGERTKAAVKNVGAERHKRYKRIQRAIPAVVVPGLLGKIMLDFSRQAITHPDPDHLFVKYLPTATALFALSLVIGTAVSARGIRRATRAVGRGFAEDFSEMRGNQRVLAESYLKSYRYIIINGNLEIVATNGRRIPPFGYVRIETAKILNGDYLEEKPERKRRKK